MPLWTRARTRLLITCVLAYSGLPAAAQVLRQARGNPVARAATFSAETRLVLVPVTVTDRFGKTITGLQPENFQVSDGSTRRDIVWFSRTDAPVSMGIVVDLSSSMQRKLTYALGAAKAAIETLNPDDAGYLVTFDHRPELRVPLTRDFAALSNRLLFARAEGNTALYDAVNLSLQHGRNSKDMRKVLVVISDGGDNRSRLMEADLIAAALEADTQIYCIGVHEPLRPKDEVEGARFLERISRLTGGLKFDVRSVNEIPAAAEALSLAMREQYVLGFKPPDEVAPAKWRKVRIKVNLRGNPLQVSARSAYFNP
ncbi:MAG TPA: VWA domain-containing protein [Bryobacteraceae bacterium]|nr:VWA domain-containing protein [Bryobacteraceae bacterium]